MTHNLATLNRRSVSFPNDYFQFLLHHSIESSVNSQGVLIAFKSVRKLNEKAVQIYSASVVIQSTITVCCAKPEYAIQNGMELRIRKCIDAILIKYLIYQKHQENQKYLEDSKLRYGVPSLAVKRREELRNKTYIIISNL